MTAPTLAVIEHPMQDSHEKLCSNLEKPLKFTVRGANSPHLVYSHLSLRVLVCTQYKLAPSQAEIQGLLTTLLQAC